MITPASGRAWRIYYEQSFDSRRFRVVTCDGADSVLENANLLLQDGLHRLYGPGRGGRRTRPWTPPDVLFIRGLINTHHHLYQTFSRNLPQVQNMELFDWLRTL